MDVSEQTWVMTGAAGKVGSSLRAGLAGRVGHLCVVDLEPPDPLHENESAARLDVRDQPAVEAALAGADGVIHLGGLPDEADFHDLAQTNIVGTFHVLEGARRAGVRRIVHASSNRVTGFYDTATTVDPAMPVRPDGFYGVSKVATEALCSLYADKFGLQVAVVRIGSFQPAPQDERQLSTWLSPRDALAAFWAAMTTGDLHLHTFYAVSANTRRWWDLQAGREIGFEPVDDAEMFAAGMGVRPQDPVPPGPQAGAYATAEFSLSAQRDPHS